ncbi:VTT domain-containing protein [Candidatus Poribacteria bacterium]
MTVYSEDFRRVIFQAIRSRTVKAYVILTAFLGIAALLVGLFIPVCRGLVPLFWLTVLSNTFIPVAPQEPVILLYGAVYSPWLVALCAGIAISMIELANYQILTPILDWKRIGAFKEKPFYRRSERYFSAFPFLSLLFACFTPVPFIPFRILAVTTRYSIKKFVLSVFLGRVPRFYLLALIGGTLNLPNWTYVIILVLAFSIAMTKGLAKRKRGSDKENGGALDAICRS